MVTIMVSQQLNAGGTGGHYIVTQMPSLWLTKQLSLFMHVICCLLSYWRKSVLYLVVSAQFCKLIWYIANYKYYLPAWGNILMVWKKSNPKQIL